MRKRHWRGLGILLVTLILAVGWVAPAHSQRPGVLPTLDDDLAVRTGVNPDDVRKVLAEAGPALSRQLAAGRDVVLPGMGTFRVVRIPENKDLVGGRPTTVPPTNYVEFLPDANIVKAANSPDARPSV